MNSVKNNAQHMVSATQALPLPPPLLPLPLLSLLHSLRGLSLVAAALTNLVTLDIRLSELQFLHLKSRNANSILCTTQDSGIMHVNVFWINEH